MVGRFQTSAARFVGCCTAGLVLMMMGGCAEQSRFVEVPSNHGYQLDDALRRLHAVGLRASFDAVSVPCGSGLPTVNVQSPRAPARVRQHTDVTLRFQPSLIGSPAVPTRRPRWAHVPSLVGKEVSVAVDELKAISPCIRVRPAAATSASRLIVVEQSPSAGTRVPAYGVSVGRGWRPTTVKLAASAQ